MNFFVHPQGICESKKIGIKTKIWAFSHVLPEAKIGDDCNICDHVFIENDVTIGNRVTIKCGVQIWDGISIEDDVFIGPNVTFGNDKYPKSKHYPQNFLKTVVRKGSSIGENATILPGIELGINSFVGAGSVVTRNVPANAIVVGNPARISGYITNIPSNIKESTSNNTFSANDSGGLKKSKLFHLNSFSDVRGKLVAGEFNSLFPFKPKRFFFVSNVPSKHVRGEHAHKKCQQMLLCINGSVDVILDDGINRQKISLSSSNQGLYIPAGIWSTQFNHSDNCMLLVFASEHYQSSDYIRNYDEFIAYSKKDV